MQPCPAIAQIAPLLEKSAKRRVEERGGCKMSGTLVAFISADEKEVLKGGGVLPPGWFPDASEMGMGPGERVWLWPNEPVEEELEKDGGVPAHPGSLLGLACGTDSERRLAERRVAKLFGAWVVHVVFLESGSGKSDGRTGLGAVLKRAAWVHRLEESIRYWFAAEQVRNIRHLAIVLARGGPVDATDGEIAGLEREIGQDGAFRALYFADHLIKIRGEDDALHTENLWPVTTGRLLLRFLVALAGDNPELDDIFAGGVHIWKSGELLFDYPDEVLEQKLKDDLPRLYRALGHLGGNGVLPPPSPLPSVFPGLHRRLRAFGDPEGTAVDGDWYTADVPALTTERLTDKRWDGLVDAARQDFSARERKAFAEDAASGGAGDFAPGTVFAEVAQNPRAIEARLEWVSAAAADGGGGPVDAFEAWKQVTEKEKKRRLSQETLEKASREMTKAKTHYVTALYGAAAAVALSLACGYTLFWGLWALGGNAAWPLAAGCAALAGGGAFAAWGVMSAVHRHAASAAYVRFGQLAEDVDAAMDARHGVAVATVCAAETVHRRLLREGARSALERLLERVWRIVDHELQSPPLDATWRQEQEEGEEKEKTCVDSADEAVAAKERHRKEQQEAMDERVSYLKLSRWTEDLRDLGADGEVGVQVDELLREIGGAGGARSFEAFWRKLCNRTDLPRQGNIPAGTAIPEIRRWLAGLVGSLLDARQRDFRNELSRAPGARRDGLLPRAGEDAVRRQDPYTWASADANEQHKRFKAEHLFIFPKVGSGEKLPAHPASIGAAHCVMVRGMSGLPQAGLYFADIQIHGFAAGTDGKLIFKTAYGDAEDAR